MKLEVLISCMYQKDASIIQRTNIQSDVLVINQCNENKTEEFDFKNAKEENCKARIVYVKERGLSKSRNMAIQYAKADVCLICDDDEILEDNYVEAIISAFVKYPDADILTFIVNIPRKRSYPFLPQKIGYIGAMKTASCQIAFKKKSIIDNDIYFDEKMGSGTGNGGGEENKFLFDCLRKGLKIRYVPILIATVAQTDSNWFKGFTNDYFYNHGFSNRRLLGLPLAWIYGIYFSVMKYKEYQADNSFWNALYFQLKGCFKKV